MSDVKTDSRPTEAANSRDLAAPANAELLESGIQGAVKWYSLRRRYGFIERTDGKPDVFVHQTAISKSRMVKVYLRTLRSGETVEFDVVKGDKGPQAAVLTGPNGEEVRGSPHFMFQFYRFRKMVAERRLQAAKPSQRLEKKGVEKKDVVKEDVEKKDVEKKDVKKKSGKKKFVPKKNVPKKEAEADTKDVEADKKEIEPDKKDAKAEMKEAEAEKNNVEADKNEAEAEKKNVEAEKKDDKAEKKEIEAEKNNAETEKKDVQRKDVANNNVPEKKSLPVSMPKKESAVVVKKPIEEAKTTLVIDMDDLSSADEFELE